MRFGNLKPAKTGLSYEDLLGVPCLLILCEKGRMGDTFPHTFDCLDMRLRFVYRTFGFLLFAGFVTLLQCALDGVIRIA